MNGQRLIDIESATFTQNKFRKAVGTMTPDGYNRGFVEGNWEIDIKATMAVENQLSRPLLESIDYENNDIQLTWQEGANIWVATGVFLKDVSDDSPGVGQEVKCTFNFGALSSTSAVGNSSLFTLQLNA